MAKRDNAIREEFLADRQSKIPAAYKELASKDKELQTLVEKIKSGKSSDFNDVYKCSELITAHWMKALEDYCDQAFPVYGAALGMNRVQFLGTFVGQGVYGITSEIETLTSYVQETINAKAGLSISPVDSDEVMSIVRDRAWGIRRVLEAKAREEEGDIQEDAAAYESAVNELEYAVECLANASIDETIKSNASFQHRAGVKAYITREGASGCCEWCQSLIGTYNYADVKQGSDIWRRHRGCRCVLSYHAEKSEVVWGNGDRMKWAAAPIQIRNRR